MAEKGGRPTRNARAHEETSVSRSLSGSLSLSLSVYCLDSGYMPEVLLHVVAATWTFFATRSVFCGRGLALNPTCCAPKVRSQPNSQQI